MSQRVLYMCRECHKVFVWNQESWADFQPFGADWGMESSGNVRHPQCLQNAEPAPDEVQATFRLGGMRAAKDMLPGYTIYGTQPRSNPND
jgi:hypothetical protein